FNRLSLNRSRTDLSIKAPSGIVRGVLLPGFHSYFLVCMFHVFFGQYSANGHHLPVNDSCVGSAQISRGGNSFGTTVAPRFGSTERPAFSASATIQSNDNRHSSDLISGLTLKTDGYPPPTSQWLPGNQISTKSCAAEAR